MPGMQTPENQPGSGELIECRVTPWYFRRMGILAAMLLAFGAYFFYDGRWGYPAKNRKAAIKEQFEEEVLKGFDRAKASGNLDPWREEMRSKGWPTDKNGDPPKWVTYAAEHGIDEKPKKYTDREIEEQFWWSGGMVVAAVVVGIIVALNRNKVLRGYGDRMVMPDGVEVRFADVFRIDKRKWDNKGLAYAWYRSAPDAPERRAVIDDLKFGGAGTVLDRLLARFSGELIEKVIEPDEAEQAEAARPEGPKA